MTDPSSKARRMTLQTRLVLAALLAEPTADFYGLQLAHQLDLPSGTIYQVLARFEEWGWLETHWEDAELPRAEGRPPRRYFRFSPGGLAAARHAVDALAQRRTARTLRIRPAEA
jgi:DNA-binding PadR family transcriptional regulator